jgi:predicted transcriptional regulator
MGVPKTNSVEGMRGLVSLKVARAIRNVSQREISEKLGINQAYISLHETGKKLMPKKHRISIEKYLQMIGRITW